jgi:hypothetical protein
MLLNHLSTKLTNALHGRDSSGNLIPFFEKAMEEVKNLDNSEIIKKLCT